MSLENNKFKILFLVDVSVVTRQNEADGNVDQTINLIRSCVLKVLLHFTTLVKDENRQLQWGFKFYNTHKQRYTNRNIFRDIDIKQFEEFENDLEQLLETSFTHHTPSSLSQQNLESGCDRSDQLSTQLKDIIYDFQWQGPDISSPVKLPRRSSLVRPPPNTSTQLNAVFLISDCPHTIDDVASFATCEGNISVKDLLSEILSPSVYQQFHVARDLRLFWIDTDTIKQKVRNDYSLCFLYSTGLVMKHLEGCEHYGTFEYK